MSSTGLRDDVTSQVADDIAHRVDRANLSQYRLQIDTPTNGNSIVDKARFSLATWGSSA